MQLRIVEAVLAVNDNRKRAMARKVSNAAGGSLRGKTVAVLGLTFKPDTDDMREAPSIPLVTGLLDLGAKVRAHDPVGMEQARKELPDIEYCDDPYACVKGADAMVVVTEWVQYRTLDLERLKREMAQPVVVDLRNIYRPEDMAALGFVYESVGRPDRWRGVDCRTPRRRGIQYAAVFEIEPRRCGILDRPPSRTMTDQRPLPLLRHPASDRRRARRIVAHARRQQCRGAGGASRRRQDHAGAAGAARRTLGEGQENHRAGAAADRGPRQRRADGQDLGRARRRNRRLPRPLRLEDFARDPDRGRHRRHLLAPDSRRSRTQRHRRGAVRRISRALARCRSGAGAGARCADRLARGLAHPGDVGDARRCAGGKTAR